MRVHAHNSWKILLIGNNPIEMNLLVQCLEGIPYKRIFTEMAFSHPTVLQRLANFAPQHILADDNVGRETLLSIVRGIRHSKFRNVPITVLKNSNYQEAIGNGVMNYVLKRDLTGERLYLELLNSNHFLQMQRTWRKDYSNQKSSVRQWLRAAVF